MEIANVVVERRNRKKTRSRKRARLPPKSFHPKLPSVLCSSTNKRGGVPFNHSFQCGDRVLRVLAAQTASFLSFAALAVAGKAMESLAFISYVLFNPWKSIAAAWFSSALQIFGALPPHLYFSLLYMNNFIKRYILFPHCTDFGRKLNVERNPSPCVCRSLKTF